MGLFQQPANRVGEDMRWGMLVVGSLWVTTSVHAGVPQVIHPSTGETIGWETPDQIPAIFDSGSLGVLTNAQARTLVEAMMGVWDEVPTARVAFAPPGVYEQDITHENVAGFVDGTICTDDFPPDNPAMQRGESPIIFDDDGRIIDLLAGKGASQKIVGKSALRCYTGTLDNPVHATQAFAIFNGLFIDGKSGPDDLALNVYAGIILHELGHFVGLHHSMVNEGLFEQLLTNSAALDNSRFVPVMFPLVARESVAATVLKPDDIAAISALYPETSGADLASIEGTIHQNSTDGFRGANVVARRQDDPLCQAVATISGRYCTALLDDSGRRSLLGTVCAGPAKARGDYRIEGLLPGDYTVEVSEVTTLGGARDNMFPKSGNLNLPGPAEYFSSVESDHDAPGDKATLVVTAGTTIPAVDIFLNGAKNSGKPSISVEAFPRRAESDCVTDPVDYETLVASVTADGSSDAELDLGSLESPHATNGGGCILMAAAHAGGAREGRGVRLGVWCVVVACGVGVLCGQRRRKRGLMLCAVWIIAAPGGARAASMLPATPTELVALAGQVFLGTCEGVDRRVDPRGFMIDEVTYRVDQMIKGPAQTRVVFRLVTSMMAESGDAGSEPTGSTPSFRVGSRDMLFLYPESRWGYTSPVAGAQGRFQVWHDAEGHAVVRNPFAGPSASAGLAAGKAAQSAGAPAVTPPAATLSPAELIRQFQQLMHKQNVDTL